MKNFTSLLSARIFYTLCLGSFLLSATLLSSSSFAQNGSLCYKPITGPKTSAGPVGGTVVEVGFINNNGPQKLINGNTGDYAEIGNLLGVLSSRGVRVTDSSTTYPSGWYAGFVVKLGNTGLLNADVLEGIQIQTYNNGSLVETHTVSNGIGVTIIAEDTPDKVYLSFKTTGAFNEIRLVKGSVVATQLGSSSLQVFYAMAFDPACGKLDPNTNCYDQIAGNETVVNFNAGLLNTLATLDNPGNLTDGNKETAASLILPAGANLLSTTPYVGVKSLQTIYPAGYKTGFIVQKNAGLLSADLINVLSIRTYLHGVLQDSQPVTANGVLNANLISSAPANPLQELSITTTKPFNEVRLVATGVLAANLGTLNIYYAFEGPGNCTDCKTALTSDASTNNVFTGQVVNRDRDPGNGLFDVYDTFGFYGVAVGSITGGGNLVTPSLDDFASVDAIVSSGGFRMTVKRTGGVNYPIGTVAGFAIKKSSGILGLLDASLLGSISIKLYKDDEQLPVQTIGEGSVINLGLLTTNGINFVGGKSTVEFDEIEIQVNQALALGTDFDVYYAYVQLDTDGDGIPDCIDYCAGDDAIDSDGDGTPDACDGCNTVNKKSATIDTDGDGTVNSCDLDSDNDSIPDTVEDTNGNGDPNDDDADGDGVPNYLDLDSDDDGILDLRESGVTIGTQDTDNNGVLNSGSTLSTSTPKDTDGDTIPDYLDLDSDNDAIFDLYEGGVTGYTDSNSDGVVDGPDADNDGIQDSVDNADAAFGSPNATLPKDQDGDGVADFRDLDSDNDGINDIIESGKTGLTDAGSDGMVDGPDADGDGIQDSADNNDEIFGSPSNTTPVDTDGDGVSDQRDLDSDNDTVSDLVESGLVPPAADADDDGVVDDGIDADGDGIQDLTDGNTGAYGDAGNTTPKNSDSGSGSPDTIPDYKDPDSDGDGTNDINENGRGNLDPNNDGKVDNPSDPDGDGIANNGGVDFKPTTFGGLGNGFPDIAPGILTDGATFNKDQERDVVIIIGNFGTTSTKNPFIFSVSKIDQVFTVTIDPNATTAGVSGTTNVNNSDWIITEDTGDYIFTLKEGKSLNPLSFSRIGMKLKATGPKGGLANIITRIVSNTAGGETPTTNNIVTFKLGINQ